MGKGSGRRPTFISEEQFAENMARWQTPKPKKERYEPPPLIGRLFICNECDFKTARESEFNEHLKSCYVLD